MELGHLRQSTTATVAGALLMLFPKPIRAKKGKRERLLSKLAFPKPAPEPKQRGHKDPVTPEMRRRVFARDQRCVATLREMEFPHLCATQWGDTHSSTDLEKMTLEHVHEDYGKTGVRAKSDMDHLVTLCGFAALVSGWNLANKDKLRKYIKQKNRDLR